MDRRSRILARLSIGDSVGVEIGALDKPLVTRDMGEILYVDHADTATLRNKYRDDSGVRVDNIVDVDGVWGANTLLDAIGGRKVDYVLASHVIEHVPDLITWLNELQSILTPGGQIRLAIPDMRYTFDCLRRETVFSDVLTAYIARARRPMPREVMDFICNAADVRTDLLWHKPANRAVSRRLYTFAEAAQLGEASMRGEYHDVHCWTFTDTAIGDMEFYVSLAVGKMEDSLSWRQMERAARPNPASGLLRPFFTSLHPRVLKPRLIRFGSRYCPSLLEHARHALRT